MLYIIVVNCGGFNSIESAVHASSNHDTITICLRLIVVGFFYNNSFEMNKLSRHCFDSKLQIKMIKVKVKVKVKVNFKSSYF